MRMLFHTLRHPNRHGARIEIYPQSKRAPQTIHNLTRTGVINSATPTDCLRTNSRRDGVGLGMISPYILFASSANHSMNEAP